MEAKEMLEKLGYIQDKEPRFNSLVSYIKYCEDGCCREYDLIFYKDKSIEIQEIYTKIELLQAINQQCKELGWFE